MRLPVCTFFSDYILGTLQNTELESANWTPAHIAAGSVVFALTAMPTSLLQEPGSVH